MQEQALNKAYPDAVHRIEKASGTSMNNRLILDLLLNMVGKGTIRLFGSWTDWPGT